MRLHLYQRVSWLLAQTSLRTFCRRNPSVLKATWRREEGHKLHGGEASLSSRAKDGAAATKPWSNRLRRRTDTPPRPHRPRSAAVTNGSQQTAAPNRSDLRVYVGPGTSCQKQFPSPPQVGSQSNCRKHQQGKYQPDTAGIPTLPQSILMKSRPVFACWWGGGLAGTACCVCGLGEADNEPARSPCLVIKGLRSLAA